MSYLAAAVWVKPPDVQFRGINPPTSGNEVTVQTGGFVINVTLDVSYRRA